MARRWFDLGVGLVLVATSGCVSLPHDAHGNTMPFDDDAVVLPEHTAAATLPDALRALKVRLVYRYYDEHGVPQSGSTPAALRDACAANGLARLRSYGWEPVEDPAADLVVELACSGALDTRGRLVNELQTLQNSVALEFRRPANVPGAVVRDSNNNVLDTIDAGARHLRCELPASPDRARTCGAMLREWDDAWVGHQIATSTALTTYAATRHPQ